MGCLFAKSSSDGEAVLLRNQILNSGSISYKKDNYTDCDTSSVGNSASDEARLGPTGDNFPSWTKDEDVSACYSCEKKFNKLTERKHHCRRCRNIFCHNCSSNECQIKLFAIPDPVRVCDKCRHELPFENNYIDNQRAMLMKGNNFKKSIHMGLSSKIVFLRLMMNETELVYDDETRSEPTQILLKTVQKIMMTSLKAFEIQTETKSFNFESDSSSTQKAWIEALKIATDRANGPSLRERVENERRLKKESEKKELYNREIVYNKEKQRIEREKGLAGLRGKYGLS
eukprot:gene7872-10686_t